MKNDPAGFVWCSMCGYNATLTQSQRDRLARFQEDACRVCGINGDFTLLAFGDALPEEIAPDEPMPAYEP